MSNLRAFTGKETLVGHYNREMKKNLTAADVVFSIPVRNETPGTTTNSVVRITPRSEFKGYGSCRIAYDRVHVSTLGAMTVDKGTALRLHELLDAINTKYGLALTQEDVEDAELDPDQIGDVLLSLQFKPESVMFYGGSIIYTPNYPDPATLPPDPENPTNPPAGELISTFCQGANKFGNYHDGFGGVQVVLIENNSVDCGWTDGPPATMTFTPATIGINETGQAIVEYTISKVLVTSGYFDVTLEFETNATIADLKPLEFKINTGAWSALTNNQIRLPRGEVKFSIRARMKDNVVLLPKKNFRIKVEVNPLSQALITPPSSIVTAVEVTRAVRQSVLTKAAEIVSYSEGQYATVVFDAVPPIGEATQIKLLINKIKSEQQNYTDLTGNFTSAGQGFTIPSDGVISVAAGFSRLYVKFAIPYNVSVTRPKGHIVSIEESGSVDIFSNSNFPLLTTVDIETPAILPPGMLLSYTCEGTDRHAVYSDGNGGTNTVVEPESTDCGYVPPQEVSVRTMWTTTDTSENTKVTVTRDGGKVKFIRSGGNNTIRANTGFTTGKHYWEIKTNVNFGNWNSEEGVGIITGDDPMAPANQFSSRRPTSWMYNSRAEVRNNNQVLMEVGDWFEPDDVVGFALDMDAGTLSIIRNTLPLTTIVTGLAGKTIHPAATCRGYNPENSRVILDTNFGTKPFVFTPPAGFEQGAKKPIDFLYMDDFTSPTKPYAGTLLTDFYDSDSGSLPAVYDATNKQLVVDYQSGSPAIIRPLSVSYLQEFDLVLTIDIGDNLYNDGSGTPAAMPFYNYPPVDSYVDRQLNITLFTDGSAKGVRFDVPVLNPTINSDFIHAWSTIAVKPYTIENNVASGSISDLANRGILELIVKVRNDPSADRKIVSFIVPRTDANPVKLTIPGISRSRALSAQVDCSGLLSGFKLKRFVILKPFSYYQLDSIVNPPNVFLDDYFNGNRDMSLTGVTSYFKTTLTGSDPSTSAMKDDAGDSSALAINRVGVDTGTERENVIILPLATPKLHNYRTTLVFEVYEIVLIDPNTNEYTVRDPAFIPGSDSSIPDFQFFESSLLFYVMPEDYSTAKRGIGVKLTLNLEGFDRQTRVSVGRAADAANPVKYDNSILGTQSLPAMRGAGRFVAVVEVTTSGSTKNIKVIVNDLVVADFVTPANTITSDKMSDVGFGFKEFATNQIFLHSYMVEQLP